MPKSLLLETRSSLSKSLINEVNSVFSDSVLVGNEIEAVKKMEESEFEVLFYHVDECFDLDFVDSCHQKNNDLRIIVIMEGAFHDYLEVFLERPYLKNFISTTKAFPLLDFVNTVHKLGSSENIFGLNHFFPKGTPMHEVTICESRDKEKYIQDSLQFLINGMRIKKQVQARIGNVLDEMMMNILWDAPRDEDGNPMYNHVSRKERISLDSSQAGTIGVAYNSNYIGLSASDPFGAITHEKIMKFFQKCFYGRDQIGSEGAGAGLGLYMIYQYAQNFTINVRPGKKTEFIMIFDHDFTIDDEDKVKSFHFFEEIT